MGKPLEIIIATASTGLGAVFSGAGVAGYLTVKLGIGIRVLVVFGGMMLLIPDWRIGAVGFAIAGFALAGQTIISRTWSIIKRA